MSIKSNILKSLKEVVSLAVTISEDATPKPVELAEAPVEKVAVTLAQGKLEDGTVIEADAFEAGSPVFIVNEEDRIPLPIGEYDFDGKVLVVAEEGIIAEIREATEEAPEDAPAEEVAAEAEFVTVADFNKAIDEIKSMLSKQEKKSEVEIAKEKEFNLELQKKLDEIPDAKLIKHAPKEKVILAANSKKGRITQFLNTLK
jgi:hypothetical protein